MNTSSKPAYQLTPYPIGSLREIWTLSWPLMLSLLSGSLMMFIDRLYLAQFSTEAMNALAVAGMTSFLVLVLPLAICEITEVFVGRLHGASQFQALGKPVWHMVFFSFCSWPLISFASRLIAPIAFGQNRLETEFFITFLDYVTPSMLASIAFMGFFIATGKTKVITLTTIAANVINAILAPLLIFGTSQIPSMGIKGTAIATACAHGCQCLFLAIMFLQKRHRISYNTAHISWDKGLFLEMLRVGTPTGFSRTGEVLAHCVYFQLMTKAGKEALTCVAFVQSFYLLFMFSIDAVAKSVTAVASNLIGGGVQNLIPKALTSGYKLHFLLFCIVAPLCYYGVQLTLAYALSKEDMNLLDSSDFLFSVKIATLWMCLFFLFDGFAWVTGGYLTAIKDTKFIFWVSTMVNWLFYITPLYLLVTFAGAGGAMGWAAVTLNSCLMFALFFSRARRKMNIRIQTAAVPVGIF